MNRNAQNPRWQYLFLVAILQFLAANLFFTLANKKWFPGGVGVGDSTRAEPLQEPQVETPPRQPANSTRPELLREPQGEAPPRQPAGEAGKPPRGEAANAAAAVSAAAAEPPPAAAVPSRPALAIGFDGAAPRISRGVVHLLPSIPPAHRIPPDALRNTTEHFLNWTAHIDPDYLFVYNPSIIALPESVLADLAQNRPTPTADGNPTLTDPVYLASYRLSSIHSCGFRSYDFWNHVRNLFGFALLDASLEIVPGSDVVIDLNAHFGKRLRFQDLRMFLISGVIHLSTFASLVPVKVSRPAPEGGDGDDHRRPDSRAGGGAEPLRNLYGDGLRISVVGGVVSIYTKGKNFQYFHPPGKAGGGASSQGGKRILMEAWPLVPRVVLEVDLDSKNSTRDRRGGRKVPALQSHESSSAPPDPGFSAVGGASLAPLAKMFLRRERGTACCVRIRNVHFQNLTSDGTVRGLDHILVGVAHTKTPQRVFNYLSRLYAFDPHPPYRLVAMSSLFCFGFPRGRNEADTDPYASVTTSNRLNLGGRKFDCPKIHFASGIVEKVGDESKIIVAYGVNDCVSRMVEIDKRDFAQRLFKPV